MNNSMTKIAERIASMQHFKQPILSAVLALVAVVGLNAPVFSQEQASGTQPATQATEPPARTIQEVLDAVRAERRAVSEANREREARFRRAESNQEAELNRLEREVAEAEAEASRLEALRNELDRELEELRAQLAERQGEFGELFGVARAAAADLNEQLNESLISTQYPGRGRVLTRMARASSLPTIEELEALWYTMLQEAGEQGKVVRYDAPVITGDNRSDSETVVRIGSFSAFTEDGFLIPREGTLRYLVRQPGGGALGAADEVFGHDGQDVVEGLIDPSLGTLLGLVVETPTFGERVAQGGGIGYAIIVVAVFGILLAVYRWAMLILVERKVAAQRQTSTPSSDNPLGRVMIAYDKAKGADLETLQMRLDDAVLKELPKLESGLNVVKVLAAVAPLMGLLGTVIGMIVTFQAITLFGTGDPKLMAGGISQALVTTVQGLIAAIPLLLLHAFASGASRRVSQILEEQSVSLVAESAAKAG
jgi:biopolymer transport protein ExbB